jgi:hypothetical protein
MTYYSPVGFNQFTPTIIGGGAIVNTAIAANAGAFAGAGQLVTSAPRIKIWVCYSVASTITFTRNDPVGGKSEQLLNSGNPLVANALYEFDVNFYIGSKGCDVQFGTAGTIVSLVVEAVNGVLGA